MELLPRNHICTSAVQEEDEEEEEEEEEEEDITGVSPRHRLRHPAACDGTKYDPANIISRITPA